MFGLPEILQLLNNWNIKEGSNISVIVKYKDAQLIGINNRRFIIDNDIADRIRVSSREELAFA